jgi:hypothetical protein
MVINGLVEISYNVYFNIIFIIVISSFSQTLHSKTASQVDLNMTANLFPAEVNMIRLLEHHIELTDLLRNLPAAE